MNLKQVKQSLNNNIELVFKNLNIQYEVFGDNIYSTCPAHDNSDNPRAFSFSKEKGIWKCWTRDCQHHFGNDIFGIIRGSLSLNSGEEVDFKQALKWSCNLLNVKKKKIKDSVEIEDNEFDKVIDIFSSKSQQYDPTPISIDCNITYPSKYFLSRGFKKETLQHFNVGDCHDKGSPLKDRSIIPIHSDSGDCIVGLIGRAVKEYRNPKFLIYPTGFDKRYFFYNYHNAIEKAKHKSCLYVVEGQGDVWKLYEHGVHNVVGIFGKTISKQHEEKLLSLPITHLIILTDNDQAGRESKIQIKRQLGRSFKLTFPKMTSKDVGDMSSNQIQEMLSSLKGTY